MATPHRAEIGKGLEVPEEHIGATLKKEEKLPLSLDLTEKLQGPSIQIMAKLDKGEKNTLLYGMAIESMINTLNVAIESASNIEQSKQANVKNILENYKKYLTNFNPEMQENASEFQAEYRKTFEALEHALAAPLV